VNSNWQAWMLFGSGETSIIERSEYMLAFVLSHVFLAMEVQRCGRGMMVKASYQSSEC